MQVKNYFVLVTVLFFLSNNVAWAEYDAAELKTLFTDKNQRAKIDAMRAGTYSASNKQQVNKVKVQGYVTRSDGKSVVWLNNKNTLESTKIGDIKVHRASIGKNKKVGITLDGQHVHLKPGQTWNKETGKIVDTHK